jgi:hypothetical protein
MTNLTLQAKSELIKLLESKLGVTVATLDVNELFYFKLRTPEKSIDVPLGSYPMEALYNEAFPLNIDFANQIGLILQEWKEIGKCIPGTFEWEEQATGALLSLKTLDAFLGISDLQDEIITQFRILAIAEASQPLSTEKQNAMEKVLQMLSSTVQIDNTFWDEALGALEKAGFDINCPLEELSKIVYHSSKDGN